MPITHVAMLEGKPEQYRTSILDSIYASLRNILDVPEGDCFMTISEHSPVNFRYGQAFGIKRTDDLLYIRITIFDTRPQEQKAALFKELSRSLQNSLGIRPEDVFVLIYESKKENWSVGLGEMQFKPGNPSHA